jgi:hypothetical protein
MTFFPFNMLGIGGSSLLVLFAFFQNELYENEIDYTIPITYCLQTNT